MQDREQELQDRIIELLEKREKFDVGTDEYYDVDFDLREAEDDLAAIHRVECVNTNQHMKMIVPERGYDVCFNCGAKN